MSLSDSTSRGSALTVAPSLNRWARHALTSVAFWGAIVMPLAYVPLFLSGIGTVAELGRFLGLVLAHLLALFGGHGYHHSPD